MARNDYNDLPLPKRANDIVAEARQRLAASGGKASMLPAMIQKVTQEYRSRDDANDQFRGTDSFNMPNDMENYIDKVLQMSGMTGGGNAGATQAAGVGADVPVPTPRPDDTNVAAAPAQQDDGNVAIDDGSSFGTVVASLLGAGGVAGLAKYLYSKYGQQAGQGLSDVEQSIASTMDEGQRAANGEPDVAPKQDRITGENRPQLEGPRQALPAPPQQITDQRSPVDESIDQTMTTDPTDQQFQDRVEGRAGSQAQPGDNRFADVKSPVPDMNTADIIDQAMELANSGNARQAAIMLRNNGINLDDNMLRALIEKSNTFKSLASRAGQRVETAAGRAAAKSLRSVRP